MRSRWLLAIWFCALGPALLFGPSSKE